ncbi:MAG: hypothetical protein Q8P28_11450, partial [Deltaproteobacteria bacterium]|nr:hypothetical protein [Deltaproteobacteria bacterium]
MDTTVVFEQLIEAWDTGKRHVWVEGGTAASKTFSVVQLLVLIAEKAKFPILISIVSESIPHIKRGCLRDFQNIMGDNLIPNNYNKTDFIYTFDFAKIEFFSADDPSKQRGARRDILFVNEANNIPYDAFRELDARTKTFTIADWNPTSEFWFHSNDLVDDENSKYIHCTYKDAINVIPQSVVENILGMGARDPNWKRIYIDGLIGKVEGLVHPFFEQVDVLPDGDPFYGLDFGFTGDPAALSKHVIIGENLYSQELFYETGLTNDQI